LFLLFTSFQSFFTTINLYSKGATMVSYSIVPLKS
jgi:hypothetical protein